MFLLNKICHIGNILSRQGIEYAVRVDEVCRMKTKNLSKRHFRYVTKQVIKNPMIYIDDFFKYQASIGGWIRDIDLTINAGAYSAMACPLILENGFHCKQIIEQVEVAYIVYKQCGLKKQSDPLSFYKTKEDYFNYTRSRKHTFNGEIDPADTLSKFFSFQSLSKWYSTLDDIMMYLTNAENSDYDRFGDKIVGIKELLFRLAYALYDIHKNGGIPVPVSSYFIAQPAEVFVGKMPRSKLGELMDSLMDKHREKLAKELDGEDEQNVEEQCEIETSEVLESQDESVNKEELI